MVYRLVYRDSSDTLWVQYGADAVYHRPTFLQMEHAFPESITNHTTIETALAGIERFNEFDSSVTVKIQFAKSRDGLWADVVDDKSAHSHIHDMIAC